MRTQPKYLVYQGKPRLKSPAVSAVGLACKPPPSPPQRDACVRWRSETAWHRSFVGKLVQDNRYCRRRTQRLIASGQERVLVSVQSLFICKRGFRIFCLLLITFEVATWRFVVRFSPSRSKTRCPCECFGAIVSAPAELMQGAIAERELRDQEAERLRITGWPSSLSILIFKGGKG